MKVAQSCPTLCIHMDQTVHGIIQARMVVWVAIPFSKGSPQPKDWTQISCIAGGFSYQLSHQGRILEWVAYPFSGIFPRSSWLRNQTRVSCIADRFFTSWTTREAPSGLYQKGVQSSDQYPKDSHLSPTLTHVPIRQKLHKLSHARHYPWISERLETNKIGGPTLKGFYWFFIVK